MTDDILHGPLVGKIFRFALPAAITIICEQLVNNTDVILLGKYVGDSAMAAVGNDTPVVSLLVSLLVGLSLGGQCDHGPGIGRKEKRGGPQDPP